MYLECMEDKASAYKFYFSSLQMNLCSSVIVSIQFEEGSFSGKKELEVLIGGSPLKPKKRKVNIEDVISILEEKENEEDSFPGSNSVNPDDIQLVSDEGDLKKVGEM